MTSPDTLVSTTPQATDIVVEGRELTKVYGSGDAEVRALDGVSIAFPRGQFTAVMGPSGSGKSTMMHILAGLDTPTSGTVLIEARDITAASDSELTLIRRGKVGFIFQFFNLLPMLTAEENMELPLRLAGVDIDKAWKDELVASIGLGNRLHHRPSELSGGQQQRVAVGRALLTRPAIIFGDEPTGNLDSKTSAEVMGLLRHAVDAFGQTVAVVTHDPRAASYADRIIFLQDGKIVRDGPGMTSDAILDVMKGLE
jgi:putative ABC transport system ATP-binding protein